ncbi:DUF4139 domain-containing protein [Methanimicrococcus blatticola]|uniref:Uncharacterized protein (TIGR02231 family) n=1 Tax=Methanimicrococcus blatticola TaxID=91560 RepID=A0A484F5A9_9EURY|nr:DUF4139 domain-containing protein [Methanimicrococcus blatticola]MBZ3934878.1 mucoidy inhibitor MuiA family protein [Methanimicrococcus blatticola]MCC2509023.1 DUF4139 domain-containing protein [Methanimicrococcus blatticola]TDQ70950.1 uncharacterized protein (TIGR02231 family) [Methanimicrococcus blatticola]
MENYTISSKVEEASVFYNGAELVHTAKATLKKGSSEVYIDGFSPSTDQKSIKIKTTNGVVISSFEFSVNYLKDESLGEAAQKLKEEIQAQQKEYEKVNTAIRINEEMLNMLRESIEKKTSGPKKGADINELMKALDFFKTKSVELEDALFDDREKSNLILEKINDLSAQFNQESAKNTKASGILKLNLSAPADCDCDLMIRCYTSNAGWYPYHDINVATADSPVKIISKAKVRQTTGIDWEKVKITLSTAVPSMGKTAPLFNAWFLNFVEPYRPPVSVPGIMQKSAARLVQNDYSYDSKMAEVSAVMEYQEECCDFNPVEPIYVIDGVIVDSGYFYSIDQSMVKENVFLDPATAASKFGPHASAGAYVITLKSGMEDFVTESENQLNVTYEIDLPYSIPGNGKEQSIELKSSEMPATFIYYCAPKLDYETYLIAEIAGWESLGLLSGTANVTYDGTFIGETYINADSTSDKLSLTLGTDKRVTVKREKMKEFSSKGLFGSDMKQEFAYRLTVRNNRTVAGRIVLKDQYPISSNKEITVELSKESTPFSFNKEDIGVVTWEYDMKPGESKVFNLVYSVKYPKGKELNF